MKTIRELEKLTAQQMLDETGGKIYDTKDRFGDKSKTIILPCGCAFEYTLQPGPERPFWSGSFRDHDPLRILTADWIHGECESVHLDVFVKDSKGNYHLEASKNPAAVALGKIGGSAKSDKKSKSSAANGKKGGWPKGKPRKTPQASE